MIDTPQSRTIDHMGRDLSQGVTLASAQPNIQNAGSMGSMTVKQRAGLLYTVVDWWFPSVSQQQFSPIRSCLHQGRYPSQYTRYILYQAFPSPLSPTEHVL